jgi:hypothetical protein
MAHSSLQWPLGTSALSSEKALPELCASLPRPSHRADASFPLIRSSVVSLGRLLAFEKLQNYGQGVADASDSAIAFPLRLCSGDGAGDWGTFLDVTDTMFICIRNPRIIP